MAMESTPIKKGLNMLATGKMILSRVRVQRLGQKVLNTRANTKKVRNKD